jgi:hypothetical protein
MVTKLPIQSIQEAISSGPSNVEIKNVWGLLFTPATHHFVVLRCRMKFTFIKIMVFWVVISFSFVGRYWCLRGTFYPEEGCSSEMTVSSNTTTCQYNRRKSWAENDAWLKETVSLCTRWKKSFPYHKKCLLYFEVLNETWMFWEINIWNTHYCIFYAVLVWRENYQHAMAMQCLMSLSPSPYFDEILNEISIITTI